MIRYAESINQGLFKLLAEDKRVYLIGEDILDPYGGAFKTAKGLSTAFPDQVITTPISEAGICGFSIGMALRGMIPIMEVMFGDFITLCADQIINQAVKFRWMYNDQVRVPLVIRTPMGGRRGYGPTHSQTLETIFLNVPMLRIVAPSLYHNPGEQLYHNVRATQDPLLFIENKSAYSQKLQVADECNRIGQLFYQKITQTDGINYTISLSTTQDEAPDVTVIAYGGTSTLAAEAAMNVFLQEEINVEVLIPSLVKPIPLYDLLPSVKESGRVLIVEESHKTSGWGAEVSSQIYEKLYGSLKAPIRRIGAKDTPISNAIELENQILPSKDEIMRAIVDFIS